MGILELFFGKQTNKTGTVRGITQENVMKDWENIRILLSKKGPSQLRQALITADKSLDNVLRDLVVGETMGDRLKNSKDMFDWNVYQKIWEAHKLRNNIVHESNFDPPYFVVNEAIYNIQKALKLLGIKV